MATQKVFQFNGPTGVVTVGEDLARVYRRTLDYSEILPEEPETEDEAPASPDKDKAPARAGRSDR